MSADGGRGLRVEELEVTLSGTRILGGVSFEVPEGATVGLVEESGSGKSTIAGSIVGIHRPSAGRILFQGAVSPAGRATREPGAAGPS
ncbi:MAG: putative transport ATP-binding subunit [Naasia sp.]|nr:putative transport ATP-binding subunit [Naasia sp.]